MQQDSTPAPVRGALFYTAKLLLLVTVAPALQAALGGAGSVVNQVLFSLGLALAFVHYGEHRSPREVFRLHRLTARAVVRSVLLGLCALALVQALGALTTLLVEQTGGKMLQYYNVSGVPFVIALLVLGIVPPVCEEVAYRGYLQQALVPLGPRAGVVVTALLFGAMHFSLIRLMPLALLGLIFGATVQRSGSLYSSMIMHFVNNAAALGLTYYATGIPSLTTLGFPVLIGSVVVLGGLAWLLVRSFGPADLAGAPPEAGHAPADLPRLAVYAMLAVLVPAILIYAYAASSELAAVFGGR
ncbi:MAG TPA: type II CAAX endopeptidase family protein [Symbiobacteriaceae bacterium]|nr:type II CAAX endopeptidase family protein [Symbiobacteriaceae bacterium]